MIATLSSYQSTTGEVSIRVCAEDGSAETKLKGGFYSKISFKKDSKKTYFSPAQRWIQSVQRRCWPAGLRPP